MKPKTERHPRAGLYSAMAAIGKIVPALSFMLLVVVPSAIAIGYYAIVASPQYVSSANFAVRGITDTQLSFLAMGNILGSNPQAPDSYIVVDYVRSAQLIRDLRDDHQVDLRQLYSRPGIDPLERIEPDMPIDYFVDYWNRKVDISYNSTTGNITFRVRAFSAEDAKLIGDAVMAAGDRLVQELANNARTQLITAAQEEVERTQTRLADVRSRLLTFREAEQVVDLQQLAVVEQTVLSELESRLTELETRRGALEGQLSADSPSVRQLDRQIESVKEQIEERRSRLGSGRDAGTGAAIINGESVTLSAVANDFRQLTLEQEYAETAYTQALASLEAAIADARKQDRYFAVFTQPQQPDVPTEPNRLFFAALFTLGSLAIWGIGALVVHAIRERAT